MKKYIAPALAALLVLLVAVVNTAWLKLDATPQRWDESIHLNAASAFGKALKNSPAAAIKAIITQETYYPPLVPFSGALASFGGKTQDSYTYVMALWWALLLASVYLYAAGRFGPAAGFAAAAVTAAYPILIGEGHYFMFDLPLCALFMACMVVLERTRGLADTRMTALLGLLAGLAMLVKWTFVIYFMAPFAAAFFFGERGGPRKKGLFTGLLVMLAVTLPWYGFNMLSIVMNILKYSYERGVTENLPPVWSLPALTYYFRALPEQMTWLFFAAFAACAALVAADKKHRVLLLYFLVPIIIFTLLHNKKDRYTMPVLPLAAVITSYAVYRLKDKRAAAATAAALATAAIINFTAVSLPVFGAWPGSRHPSRADWKEGAFMEAIAKNGPGSLAVVPDHPYMNNLNYSFFADSAANGTRITGIYNFPAFTDYFLVKTGDQGPSFSGADRRAKITAEALDPRSAISQLYEITAQQPLPDGSVATLFKRRARVGAEKGAFSADLNYNALKLAAQYLKEAQGFSMKMSGIEPPSVGAMTFSFKSGLLGDFKHKDAGLRVRDAAISVNGLALNPAALKDGRFEMLSLGAVEIRSLRVDAADLAAFAALYAKGAKDIRVQFRDGLVELSAVYSKIPLYVSLRLQNPNPGSDNSDIVFEIKKIRAGFMPVPAWLANFVLKDYNPLLNKSNSPIKVKFGQIKAENGQLSISE